VCRCDDQKQALGTRAPITIPHCLGRVDKVPDPKLHSGDIDEAKAAAGDLVEADGKAA